MKAAMRLAPRRMEVVEEPEPVPGPDQALVRIEACGICGSDLHLYLGDHPYSTFPRTPGHELSGTIAALGDDYDGPLNVGDRVAIEPLIPCGRCYACRHGRTNCCANLQVLGAHAHGGMSELFAVDTRSLYPVGNRDPELTALCHAPLPLVTQVVEYFTQGGVPTLVNLLRCLSDNLLLTGLGYVVLVADPNLLAAGQVEAAAGGAHVHARQRLLGEWAALRL